MNQAELFPVGPPVPEIEHGGYMPPLEYGINCMRAVLWAMEHYQDDNDMGWEPDSDFNVLQVAAMVSCRPEGPFCIAVLPVFHIYGVDQIYAALNQLSDAGKINKEIRYFGSRSPADGNYKGYGYRYSLPDGVSS